MSRVSENIFAGSSVTSAGSELLTWILEYLGDCDATVAELGAPWVSHVPGAWLFVYAVRQGTCRLEMGEANRSIELREGDVVVLPQCKGHRLQDAGVTTPSRARQEVWFDPRQERDVSEAGIVRRGPATRLLICRFRKPPRLSELLLTALPPCIIQRRGKAEPNPCVEPTIGLLESELARPHSGNLRIVEHLIKVLILQVGRAQMRQPSELQSASKSLLTDRIITKALGLMHGRPDISWTVATLATAVGVSRSTFAARFANLIGETPLTYLRRERMQQAADLLADETLGIKEIAALVGYDSESAFSNAFKQWSGIAPGCYRRERHG